MKAFHKASVIDDSVIFSYYLPFRSPNDWGPKWILMR